MELSCADSAEDAVGATDPESRRSSTDSDTAAEFISVMQENGLSLPQAHFVKNWYEKAALDDPVVVFIADHTSYNAYAAPTGNHLHDIRALFAALPALDTDQSNKDMDAWAFRSPADMTAALKSIKKNATSKWCLHVSPDMHTDLQVQFGVAAAAGFFPGRRTPIGRVVIIFKTTRVFPDIVPDTSLFETS
ncbi:hypothetical protein B484DRAFT_456172 [Ochromonadaceae sp. CCMP2298]|nr:hypothetical protein B484DRAFT_456172 [Ochromonadaceae sp. CCMP2298]